MRGELTLPELCEPLFQHMCRLNRAARKAVESGAGSAGIYDDEAEVRSGVRALLSELSERASTAGIADQFDKVRLCLVFFCDYCIHHSALPYASTWTAMAEVDEDPPHYAAYQEFFDIVEETLLEKSDAADERLIVLYTCMGLGFKGYLEDMPKQLQDKMRQVGHRIRTRVESENAGDICEQAYLYTDKRNLDIQPIRTLTPIGLSLVGLILMLIVLNIVLFNSASKDLLNASKGITETNDKLVAQQ